MWKTVKHLAAPGHRAWRLNMTHARSPQAEQRRLSRFELKQRQKEFYRSVETTRTDYVLAETVATKSSTMIYNLFVSKFRGQPVLFNYPKWRNDGDVLHDSLKRGTEDDPIPPLKLPAKDGFWRWVGGL